MAWLNGEDNWFDCMKCGERFMVPSGEYHQLCERCEARKRLARMGIKLAPLKKKEDV